MRELLRKMPGFGTARAVRARLRGEWREVAASPTANGALSAAAAEAAIPADRQARFANRLERYADLFANVVPWAGEVPKGYLVDFSGALTDARFRTMFGVDPDAVGGAHVATRLPVIEDGEGWFEAANWVLAAREAQERFVMMTLGACYGAQAVGCHRIVQQLNPMPSTLVAVEPVPENYEWMQRHFRNNGLDPDRHWLLPLAIAGDNEPRLFPIGAPGSGAQNGVATNNREARQYYVDVLTRAGAARARAALRNLLLHNTTGITRELVPGTDFTAEIRLVSTITLRELLSPFARVDYLEADIQQGEIEVFPPFVDLLRRKVRRIHIGTHGRLAHWSLHDLFARSGWEIVFSFEPNARHETALGSFETNDGVLTLHNPDF
jgi:Methyltransferase FkbM domain